MRWLWRPRPPRACRQRAPSCSRAWMHGVSRSSRTTTAARVASWPENPHAALVFFWPGLERQVLVSGDVRRLPPDESERYFRSRPRGSRIAAWASPQSAPVTDRAALEERWRETAGAVSRRRCAAAADWGGYVLGPPPHRVLARSSKPSARSVLLHPRRRWGVAHRASGALSAQSASGAARILHPRTGLTHNLRCTPTTGGISWGVDAPGRGVTIKYVLRLE